MSETVNPSAPGTLTNLTWGVSNNAAGATGVKYGYSFTTATAGTIATIVFTVSGGTLAGTPTVVSGGNYGIGAGTWSVISGNAFTYTVTSPVPVSSGIPTFLEVGGLTNMAIGTYTTSIETEAAGSVAIDGPTSTPSVTFYGTNTITSSLQLMPGPLSFASAPGNVTFSTTTLSGSTQTIPATQTLDIGDATGSGGGWNVTLGNTTFTSGTNTLANSDFIPTVPATDVCDTTCTPATLTSTFPSLPGTTATKLMSAAAGTGMGDQTVTIPWLATIPGSSYAGTYTSTWMVTVVSGP